MRPTRHDFESIQPLFRTASGLSRWLTRSGSLEGKAVDEPVALELAEGKTLTGRILADSGRELALSWEEIDGALELKIFPAGPDGLAAALRCSAWGMTADQAAGLDERLSEALERLTA